MYFESHAHYDDDRFNPDREALLALLPQKGIDFIVNVGADMDSSQKSVALSERYPMIYAAVGVHPHAAEHMKEEDLLLLGQYYEKEKVVAIGEIGLDYYYEHSPRDTQRYWFQKQLALAKKLECPVIIHSRDAAEETFHMIKASGIRKGVIHCYSGSKEMALAYVEMGFLIGVGGVVTFSNAKKLVETVSALSIQNILIETDCPYLSPSPNRGQRNDSQNLCYIAEKIGQIKNMSYEEIAQITMNNAVELFSILSSDN